MISSFRIVPRKFAGSAFDGAGARLYGGRWNSKGIPVAYTAGSIALAMLEMLVRIPSREALQERYVIIEAKFESDFCTFVRRDRLPANWQAEPLPKACQKIGDDWVLSRKSPVLAVPSVVSPREWNYILNVSHPLFSRIKIGRPESLFFDRRLLRS